MYSVVAASADIGLAIHTMYMDPARIRPGLSFGLTSRPTTAMRRRLMQHLAMVP